MTHARFFARAGMLVLLLALWLLGPAWAQSGRETENVFLITTDGLRWQEVFTGADAALLRDTAYVAHVEELTQRFGRETPEARRAALMPFFWNVIAEKGQLYGNRPLGCTVEVTNDMWFSYPGYNEILTGRADDEHITSNDKFPNPNVTVLEFANEQPAFGGEVAAFTTWENFPYIINEERSGVFVDAGHPDSTTQDRAMAYLKEHAPRLFFVAYGATDHFAHEGNYEAYLEAAHRVDAYIRELWTFAQSHPQYKGKTTLIITTDHGRGLEDEWTSHGRDVEHANEIWIAAVGPDTPARGEVGTCELYQNQVARTISALLGLGYEGEPGTGGPIEAALSR